jgi:hypothetical protein
MEGKSVKGGWNPSSVVNKVWLTEYAGIQSHK